MGREIGTYILLPVSVDSVNHNKTYFLNNKLITYTYEKLDI
jgi:hypothetical protein